MARLDPHSFHDTDQPRVTLLDWTARVDFDARTLEGVALLTFTSGGTVDLDSQGLSIDRVTDGAGHPVKYTLAPPVPVLGSRLRLEIPLDQSTVSIQYRTSAGASALQWLTPAQTAGGRHPYLFSQCQAIHARSILPVQDTPSVRIRYRAALEVRPASRGLKDAAHRGTDWATWTMKAQASEDA